MPTTPVPRSCPGCAHPLTSEAELFLHRVVHQAPWMPVREWSLRALPSAVMPRVAEVMQAYAEAYAARWYHEE